MNKFTLGNWTAIITNVAVVVGLVSVGLEFRDNARALEAERIDSFVQAIGDLNSAMIDNEELSEILYQAYADPDSLTDSSLDRAQHWMLTNYNNFQRVHLAHQSDMLPDAIYDAQKAGIGFAFSSDIGLGLIDIMERSGMGEDLWGIVKDSAEQARAYCLNPNNSCVPRYEAARRIGN